MAKNTKGKAPVLVPPPSKKEKVVKATKGAPEALPLSTNLTKKPARETVMLNFSVSPEFRREMKGEALQRDITVSELLRQMYAFWKAHHQ